MKSKSLIAALALVLPMSGCSLLFPDSPSNICKEENKPLSKEELIYRVFDHFYDDPLHLGPLEVPNGFSNSRYDKRHPAMEHFYKYKDAYLNKNSNALPRQIIESYYQKYPDCCIVKYPARHWPQERKYFYRFNSQGTDSKRLFYDWVYDVILFPKAKSKLGLHEQNKNFRQYMDYKDGKSDEKPEHYPIPSHVIYRGVSECGAVNLINNDNWN